VLGLPSTHSSLHYHIVFSTRHRIAYIEEEWRARLHAYVGGVVKRLDGIPLAVGGVDDHLYLLATLKPVHSIAEVMRNVKRASSGWVHATIRLDGFAWQEGYGAFTVSRSNLDTVTAYIERQAEHHRTLSFQDEYVALLRRHAVSFDERYLW
jgi:putative transposase